MARREREIDEEQKSRGVLFLLSAALLLVTGVWAVWNDNISRRPWKYFQREFRELEYRRLDEALAAEQARLEADPQYQELMTQLAEARERLRNGDLAQQIRAREVEGAGVAKRLAVVDLELRFVKSELEEAWYEYEHAKELGRPTEAKRAHVEELTAHRDEAQARLDDLTAQQERLEQEIKELRAGVTTIEDRLMEVVAERTRLEQRRDGLLVHVMGPITMLPVPRIEQTVLEEFDRNAYNQPIARVDRCVSCHIGINKVGFEEEPQPYRTHPDRERLLGPHPPEKLGCTACHEGQGAAVNSVEQAHGHVHFWEHPLLDRELIQARCAGCHASVAGIEHADRILAGQDLFEQLGCHGCHLVEGLGDLPKVGPYLRRIGAKVDRSWLLRWVTHPQEYLPHTRMPSFLFSAEQGTAVAAYLLRASAEESAEWLASHPEPAGVDPADPVLTARGRTLTETLGCRGCHAFQAGEHGPMLGATKDVAPNLARVAEKTDGRWLFHWLKSPRHFSPVSRMPSLRLDDDEARAIASYLLTLGSRKPEPAARLAALDDPEAVAAGEALVRKYGCAGCHDIPGMENESRIGVELSTFAAKPLEELFFGERHDIPRTWADWTFHKIKTPRTYETERIEQLMPLFGLEDEDIRSLRVFLASRTEHVVPAHYRYRPNDRGQVRLVEGRRLIARYNCTGCHVIEGEGGFILRDYEETPSFGPPILNGEGAKVQPDWLFGFLKAPVTIRPWLTVRMPTFSLSDEEAHALVGYFTAHAELEIPFVHVDATAVPAEHIEAARLLLSEDYFYCFSCHVQGAKTPEGPPEGWAPDFAMARRRLNPDWIVEWLRDPQRIQPGTKMPSFYPGGPDDVLDGDDERQIRAIRDYLMTLGTPDADGGSTRLVQREEEPAP
jgi:mono/diheme cytochrome c family protein